MTVTYCTAAEVAGFLQISDFSGSTTVTSTDVEALINNRESYIDMKLGHAYRSVTVTDEYHNLEDTTAPVITGDMWVKIFLDHRWIKTLDTDSNDKLEVWTGTAWEDYVTTKTEGRANDFWLNYTDGILFIRRHVIRRAYGLRLTYRYGETTVPPWVRHCCLILTAHDLVMNEDTSNILPEGGSNVSYSTKAERWKEEADEILSMNADMMVAAR